MCNKLDICSYYDDTAVVTEKTSFSEEEKTQYTSDNVDSFTFSGMHNRVRPGLKAGVGIDYLTW